MSNLNDNSLRMRRILEEVDIPVRRLLGVFLAQSVEKLCKSWRVVRLGSLVFLLVSLLTGADHSVSGLQDGFDMGLEGLRNKEKVHQVDVASDEVEAVIKD